MDPYFALISGLFVYVLLFIMNMKIPKGIKRTITPQTQAKIVVNLSPVVLKFRLIKFSEEHKVNSM